MSAVSSPFHVEPRADQYPIDVKTVRANAEELLRIIDRDKDALDLADRYYHGDHDDPYLPDQADPEYKLLAERAKTNFMELVVTAVAQQLYVDGFRTSDGQGIDEAWRHWQRSRQDARQHALYRSALIYGHAFTLTYIGDDGKTRTKGLSPRKTAAIFDDPANDIVPVAAGTIVRKQRTVTNPDGSTKTIPGEMHMWDEELKYEIRHEGQEIKSIKVLEEHAVGENPITRFACDVDLDGRTTGLVLPLKPLQDRSNEQMFDLLVVGKGGAFKVRTVSGMLPPTIKIPIYQTEIDENGDEVIVYDPDGRPVVSEWVDKTDRNGNPLPAPVQPGAARFLYAEDPDVKFGSLDETPMDGYISALDMSIRHLSSVTQMPPDWLIGQIANLSAEALQAAERALSRKVGEFQSVFGESWERVFRLAASLDGNTAAA